VVLYGVPSRAPSGLFFRIIHANEVQDLIFKLYAGNITLDDIKSALSAPMIKVNDLTKFDDLSNFTRKVISAPTKMGKFNSFLKLVAEVVKLKLKLNAPINWSRFRMCGDKHLLYDLWRNRTPFPNSLELVSSFDICDYCSFVADVCGIETLYCHTIGLAPGYPKCYGLWKDIDEQRPANCYRIVNPFEIKATMKG
jgi:hypothetical protein